MQHQKLAPKHVLVVDDLASMRNVIKAILREIGFTDIHDAPNGIDALKKLNANKYDLVICDWNMPKMTGLELFLEMKKNPEFKDIVFILVTAASDSPTVMKALEMGITDYIVKPFTPKTLTTKISKKFQL